MKAPAVCDICGTIFPSPFNILAENVGLFNIGVGPCPKCGGEGSVPDGIYSFIDNTILLLSDRTRTKSELQKLADILTDARKKQATTQELSEKIQKELPELSSLKDILPKTRTELYAFIAIILTIITILVTSWSRDHEPKIEINQVVNVLYENQDSVKQPSDSLKNDIKIENEAKTKKQGKIGRNQPCPCGSGKKYKKCCLNK
jgi:SEC-C motif-containing protein